MAAHRKALRSSLRRAAPSLLFVAALVLMAAVGEARAQGSKKPAPPEPPPPATPEAVLEEVRGLVAARRFEAAWKIFLAPSPALREAMRDPEPASELERLRLTAGVEVVGGGAGLRGAISMPEPGILEVVYDFKVADFDEDFEKAMLLPSAVGVERKKRLVFGTGALLHRAVWSDTIKIDLSGGSRGDNDFGVVLQDPAGELEERFLVGMANNAYFGIKYDKDRTVSTGHPLLMAGEGAESRARAHKTQLLGFCDAPPISRGYGAAMSLSLQGPTVTFAMGAASVSFTLSAATQSFPRVRPGLVLRQSGFELGKIILRGRLDPKWSEEEAARIRKLLAAPPPK